uniref:Rho-GAP domain-containing protein n=1 Tax=Chrysotila carterae TaxID=13221 RepID=A0A7S4BXV2_CHRCT
MFSPFFCFVRAISAPQLLHQCGDLRKGVFMWLLDLMSEVVEHQSSNRMSAEAIAIVMAPNLCTLPHGSNVDQVRELEFGKRVAKFVVALLHHYDTVKTRLRLTSNGSPGGDGISHSPVTKDGSINGRISAAV